MTTNVSMQLNSHIPDLEKQLLNARANLTQAELACADAQATYSVSLDKGRDAAVAARRVCDDAEIDRDVARRRVEVLEVSLAGAREAAETVRIEELQEKAEEAIKAYEVAARRDLPKMTIAARTLVRLWAEAEIARNEASRASGDKYFLAAPEGFRSSGYRPYKEIERTRTKRWVHPRTGDPMNDELNAKVLRTSGGAFLGRDGHSQPWPLDQEVEVDRIVYLKEERGQRVQPLIETLRIPELIAGDSVGWSDPGVENPYAVLAHLNALESARPVNRSDQRERQVKLCLVEAEGVNTSAEPGK